MSSQPMDPVPRAYQTLRRPPQEGLKQRTTICQLRELNTTPGADPPEANPDMREQEVELLAPPDKGNSSRIDPRLPIWPSSGPWKLLNGA